MRALKLLLAILLLPACVALTTSAWKIVGTGLFSHRASPAAAAHQPLRTANPDPIAPRAVWQHPGWTFGAGYILWLAVFALLPKPMRVYVLGHELTHAFWALMMGARVEGLKVRKTGGQVRSSKINWFIALAPYFFPFYAMLVLAVFFIAHAVWGLEQYLGLFFFLLGLAWSFHVTFTLMMLLTVEQPDVRSQGTLFSLVAIYSMNLLVILLTATLLSPTIHWLEVASVLGRDFVIAYGWTLDNLAALWHRLAAYAFRS